RCLLGSRTRSQLLFTVRGRDFSGQQSRGGSAESEIRERSHRLLLWNGPGPNPGSPIEWAGGPRHMTRSESRRFRQPAVTYRRRFLGVGLHFAGTFPVVIESARCQPIRSSAPTSRGAPPRAPGSRPRRASSPSATSRSPSPATAPASSSASPSGCSRSRRARCATKSVAGTLEIGGAALRRSPLPGRSAMKIRFRILVWLAAGIAALAPGSAGASGPYQITGTAGSRNAGFVRTEYTVQAGSHSLDRFKMVRVTKEEQDGARGSILFLPPLGSTFAFYEQRDANDAAGTSLAEYFAERGFDVYGYSPRFEGIPAGTCEARVLDCSVMAGWDLESDGGAIHSAPGRRSSPAAPPWAASSPSRSPTPTRAITTASSPGKGCCSATTRRCSP